MAERTSQGYTGTGETGKVSPGTPPTGSPGTPPTGRKAQPVAYGLIVFAMVMMLLVGVMHIFAGVVAIARNNFYVITPNYIYDLDLTAWGWFHVVSGVILVGAGLALATGRAWARMVAIAVAGLSAVENFFFIPYYPIWALVMITLDVLVIWALATYRSERMLPGSMRGAGPVPR